MLRRCRCGEPIDFPQGSGKIARLCAPCQHHALTTFPPDPFVASIPQRGGPRTSDEWIAEHCHEWENWPGD